MDAEKLNRMAKRVNVLTEMFEDEFLEVVELGDSSEEKREKAVIAFYLLKDMISELSQYCKKTAQGIGLCDIAELTACRDFLTNVNEAQDITKWNEHEMVYAVVNASVGARIYLRKDGRVTEYNKSKDAIWTSRRDDSLTDFEMARKVIDDYEIGILMERKVEGK